MPSMSRVPPAPDLGARFRRRPGLGRAAEARILAVRHDGDGIAHVTFELALLSQTGARMTADQRTLSAERFRQEFGDPVG